MFGINFKYNADNYITLNAEEEEEAFKKEVSEITVEAENDGLFREILSRYYGSGERLLFEDNREKFAAEVIAPLYQERLVHWDEKLDEVKCQAEAESRDDESKENDPPPAKSTLKKIAYDLLISILWISGIINVFIFFFNFEVISSLQTEMLGWELEVVDNVPFADITASIVSAYGFFFDLLQVSAEATLAEVMDVIASPPLTEFLRQMFYLVFFGAFIGARTVWNMMNWSAIHKLSEPAASKGSLFLISLTFPIVYGTLRAFKAITHAAQFLTASIYALQDDSFLAGNHRYWWWRSMKFSMLDAMLVEALFASGVIEKQQILAEKHNYHDIEIEAGKGAVIAVINGTRQLSRVVEYPFVFSEIVLDKEVIDSEDEERNRGPVEYQRSLRSMVYNHMMEEFECFNQLSTYTFKDFCFEIISGKWCSGYTDETKPIQTYWDHTARILIKSAPKALFIGAFAKHWLEFIPGMVIGITLGLAAFVYLAYVEKQMVRMLPIAREFDALLRIVDNKAQESIIEAIPENEPTMFSCGRWFNAHNLANGRTLTISLVKLYFAWKVLRYIMPSALAAVVAMGLVMSILPYDYAYRQRETKEAMAKKYLPTHESHFGDGVKALGNKMRFFVSDYCRKRDVLPVLRCPS